MSQYDPSESLIEIKQKAKELGQYLAPADPDLDEVYLVASDIMKAAERIMKWAS
jgi:hypothetical protein